SSTPWRPPAGTAAPTPTRWWSPAAAWRAAWSRSPAATCTPPWRSSASPTSRPPPGCWPPPSAPSARTRTSSRSEKRETRNEKGGTAPSVALRTTFSHFSFLTSHFRKEAAVGIFEDLKAICEITGPIGYPDEVNAYLKDRWRPLGAVEETPVGNLVAHVGGAGPKLLLDAHSDEIAFVVRAIDERGFIWITTAQQLGQPKLGLDRLLMLGQPALIVGRGGRKVEGLFATVTGHVASFERREKGRYDYNDLFVDIGARSREEAQGLGVTVGSLAIWNATTRRLGPDGKLIYGKALDARMGLAIMTEVARRVDRAKLAFDLYLGCSVQEEIGLVGAASLARYADFAQAISIEVGLAGDIPLVDERDMPVALGKGPV